MGPVDGASRVGGGRLARVALLGFGAVLAGCGSEAGSSATASSASALSPATSLSAAPEPADSVPADSVPTDSVPTDSGPNWLGIPRPPDDVAKVVNPRAELPYQGKTGTVKGRVTIQGDPPPDVALPTIPAECGGAQDTYGKAFRVAADGALADALVAVTNYEGYVPAASRAKPVTVAGCAYDRRTYVAAYGQRLEIRNTDGKLSFMPYLDGAAYRAMMIALPGGAPVKAYPLEPGRFVLRDFQGRPFLQADVYVLKYATADTTGLDGRFEIRGVPVGKARIDALLPAIDKADGKELDVVEGENVVDLVLTYDAKSDHVAARPADPWQRGASSAESPADAGKFGHAPIEVSPSASARAAPSSPRP
jgi:hypothetical protein